ncbi:MAG TPA: hypothetical protein VGD21_09915 [Lysobacter sp.]
MDANSLISQYRKTIVGVETQSCSCCGEPLIGDAWRERGCGISYEYLNDIDVRSLIERSMQSGNLTADQLEAVTTLDSRLKDLLVANGVNTTGPEFWRNGLPFGVAE